MCMSGLCACMCVYHMPGVIQRPEKVVRFPKIRVQVTVSHHFGSWEPNLNLQEQPVLLAVEPSSQSFSLLTNCVGRVAAVRRGRELAFP